MDTLIGLVGSSCTVLCADSDVGQGLLIQKTGHDKILQLDPFKLMGAAGELGDIEQFCEYIARNLALNSLRSGLPSTTHAAANFTRQELHTGESVSQSVRSFSLSVPITLLLLPSFLFAV